MAFRLLTYNIRVGGVGRVEPLARIVNACDADLVLLQEATQPAVVHQLAVLTGMADWRAFPRQSLGYMSREPVSHASWHQPRLSHHAYVEVMPAGVPLRVERKATDMPSGENEGNRSERLEGANGDPCSRSFKFALRSCALGSR